MLLGAPWMCRVHFESGGLRCGCADCALCPDMRVEIDMQVMLPLCDSDVSTTMAGDCFASPCCETKQMGAICGSGGGGAEVIHCRADKVYKAPMTDGSASETTAKVTQAAAVEMVEETPCSEMVVDVVVVANDKSSDSDKGSCKQLGESETKMECSQSLEDAGAGCGEMQERPYQGSKNSTNSTPEIQMKCKMSESGEYGESAEAVVEGAEAMAEDSVSMEVEDKRNSAAAASSATFHVATSGLGEGRSTRPMVKRVMSGVMDGKFYKREHAYRSSQRLHPEIMTKKIESYSRNLKVRRAVKVGKRNHVGGTRAKRQHAEMESTDSGSSEGSHSRSLLISLFPFNGMNVRWEGEGY